MVKQKKLSIECLLIICLITCVDVVQICLEGACTSSCSSSYLLLKLQIKSIGRDLAFNFDGGFAYEVKNLTSGKLSQRKALKIYYGPSIGVAVRSADTVLACPAEVFKISFTTWSPSECNSIFMLCASCAGGSSSTNGSFSERLTKAGFVHLTFTAPVRALASKHSASNKNNRFSKSLTNSKLFRQNMFWPLHPRQSL